MTAYLCICKSIDFYDAVNVVPTIRASIFFPWKVAKSGVLMSPLFLEASNFMDTSIDMACLKKGVTTMDLLTSPRYSA